MHESVLDKSINAIEVIDNNQFYEIIYMHQILHEETKQKRVPRFTVHLIEPYPTPTRKQETQE